MNKKVYNKFPFYFLFFLFLVCTVVVLPLRVFAQDKAPKHILVISSYLPDKENSRIIINSFFREMNARIDCRITVEYMDCESLSGVDAWIVWMQQLLQAYKNPPDLVVIVGNEGWMAYTVGCPQTWRSIPVVLGFVKSGYIDYIHLDTRKIEAVGDIRSTVESFGDFRVTGYYVRDYFRENMELVKRLQPQVRRIAYVYDNRFGFDFITPYLRKMAQELGFESFVPFYGSELTTMQLVDSLMAQDDSYAVLSSGWYTDAQHYTHAYSMLHNELSRDNSKYFYMLTDHGTDNANHLGGYYVAARDIGRDLAGLTYEVLTKGIEQAPKFQITPSSPQYYINYKTLLTSGLGDANLPPQTVFYNKEPSFLETYFWQILVLALAFLLVVLFLVARMRYYRNVTLVKTRMAEEQKRLREKADESNRLKSAFLANMSHEIRTPLNAIVGFSSQLAQTDDKEERRMYVDIIRNNNDLLLQLIDDILDLSKIEAGTLDFVYAETDVVEIFRTLEQVYRLRVKKGVVLRCELPDAECVVRTERTRITQVLSNFLSNAVKFTDKGEIRFGFEHIDGGLRFFVEDTGRGIAPENLSRVFVRFEKFDKFVPGNGLGMSICESIVKRMNGLIGVESELGKGSVFWFTLPCRIIRAEERTSWSEPLPRFAMPEKKSGERCKTILIAEDNESNYRLLSCILRNNYRLEWARTGREAVEMYREVAPDLILMDVEMPVMNGLEATALIRQEDKKIPIVVLTAHAFAEDRAKAERAGCSDFLTKPVDQNRLLEVLHRFGM